MTKNELAPKDVVRFPGLTSVAINASGTLAAVCINNREVLLYRIDRDKLEERKAIPLASKRGRARGLGSLALSETRIAFNDDEIVLLAGNLQRRWSETSRLQENNIALIALQTRTGKVLGGFEDSAYYVLAEPIHLLPHHALLIASSTVICVDLTTFRESFRVRKFDAQEHVIEEEGVSGGEQVTPNGVVYDPKKRNLHVLWREFTSSYLQSYRLYPEKNSFEGIERRPVEESLSLALEGAGLCMDPTGKNLAVWLTTMDEVVDCRTKKGLKMPETARLGRIAILGSQRSRFFDVQSALELHPWLKCDFSIASYTDTRGKEIGIRYGVGQYEAKPFFLDSQTMVLNTPGGILLAVDVESGATWKLNRIGNPLADLCFDHERRRLLTATKEGLLELSSL